MSAPRPPSRHVLVIRRRYLGDIIVLAPLLRNLRLHWPDTRLTLLCDRAYAEAAALHRDLDQVLYFPGRAGTWPRFLRELRRQRFTHVLDIDNRDKTALFTWVTGARDRLTLHRDHPKFPLRHGWVYTQRVPVSRAWHDAHHITDIYHALVEPLGVPLQVRAVRHEPDARHVDEVQTWLGALQRPRRLIVHPGSRSRFRVWPGERFAAVCDRVQTELNADVCIVAGPGEEDAVAAIRQHAQQPFTVIDRRLSVAQLAALFSQFPVLLAHDSGPMHVAAAVGTRVVALYGSQNATIWRPSGEGHQVLQTSLPCPCFPPGVLPEPCDRKDSYFSYCVRQLDVDTVFAAVAAQLTQEPPGKNL